MSAVVPFGRFLIGYDDDGNRIEKTATEMTPAELTEVVRRLDSEVQNLKQWAAMGAPCAPDLYAKARDEFVRLARFAEALSEGSLRAVPR